MTQTSERRENVPAAAAPNRRSRTTWTAARERLRDHLVERASRRALEHELAQFTTPSDRLELDTIFSRYDPAEVADLYSIVNRRRAA